jgi:uncharacterized RDD family membrane protein YckC
MDQYSIQTTQNVEIEFQVASVGDRIVALLIDWLILFFYALILLIIFGNSGMFNHHPVISFIFYFPILVYSLLCEAFLNGQSFGKMAMKMRVVRTDGNELSFGNCFIRWIFRLIDFQLTSGLCALLTVIIGGKGQRLGDIAAGTTVLKLDAGHKIEDTGFMELPNDYVPSFPEVDKLNDGDIHTIKEVLRAIRHEEFNIMKNPYLSKTNDVVSRKMGVTHQMDPYKFLHTVLLDYNFYHQ